MDNNHLKNTSIKGAAVNFSAQMMKFGLTFLNQVLLARLLLPNDFGIMAMVAPVLVFVQLFADLGLSQATIQRKEISDRQLTFLFWLNVAAASTLALIVMAISPLVGWFYHEPRVVMVTIIMGATFLLSGLSTQHMAIFTRNLQFVKLASIDFFGFFFGVIAGLLAAWHGLGYWSLVINQVVISVFTVICAWAFSTWRPAKPKIAEEWQSLLRFGGNLTGFNIVNYFARNLDNILIGKFDGEAALGIYDRAYKLLLMPMTQISLPVGRVATPLLSRLQDQPESYRKAFLRMVEIIMILTYPAVLFAIITSDHLIRIVMGERWAAVAPIFTVLGFGALFQALSQSTGWLFTSQGRTREMRNWGIFSSTMIVLSFAIGLPWGPFGVAVAYITVGTIQAPILWWYVTRSGPVTLSDLLKLVKPFVVAAVPCVAAVYALDRHLLPPGLLSLIVSFVAAHVVFFSVFMLQPSGLAIVRELWRHASPFAIAALNKVRPSALTQNRIK